MQGPKPRRTMTPVHPGEVLREEFMEPQQTTTTDLALALGVHEPPIIDIVEGRSPITRDAASCLSRFFGTTEAFWLNIQARYDLEVEKDKGA